MKKTNEDKARRSGQKRFGRKKDQRNGFSVCCRFVPVSLRNGRAFRGRNPSKFFRSCGMSNFCTSQNYCTHNTWVASKSWEALLPFQPLQAANKLQLARRQEISKVQIQVQGAKSPSNLPESSPNAPRKPARRPRDSRTSQNTFQVQIEVGVLVQIQYKCSQSPSRAGALKIKVIPA